MNFNYYQPTKIYFGKHQIDELPKHILEYGKKVLIVGPLMNKAISAMFKKTETILKNNDIKFNCFYEVEANPATKTVDKLINLINDFKPNALIAMGGGSVIDVVKIASITYNLKDLNWYKLFNTYCDFKIEYPKITKNKLPTIAIPTTSGTGSECTHAAVLTDDKGMKLTIFHHQTFIEKTILDPGLTLNLPKTLTAATAFDALSHSLESYLRSDNYLCNTLELEGIKKIFTYLPKTLQNNNIENRQELMMAACFGGIALSNSGAMLPHPLSEIIGSFIKINHGEALALVYPTFIKHTLKKYEAKYAKIAYTINPSIQDLNRKAQADIFYQMLCELCLKCNLNKNIKDYENNPDKLNKIKNFILDLKLPMEETETIKLIIEDIFR
ncbi:MAG: iron-containing alcohol dehydrogenase [Erysipelotrichaceae bacterium]|nr:iron-containing alcohol dehydrogenase [Erysipelotrichaceae bacterium]